MKKNILIFAISFFLLSACITTPLLQVTPPQAMEISETDTFEQEPTISGTGVLSGKFTIPENWHSLQLYAFAAPYLGDPDGEGIFVLDDKLNQSSLVDTQGNFRITNIPPGIYILVVGPDADTAVAYRKNGLAIKLTIDADKTLDIGSIKLE